MNRAGAHGGLENGAVSDNFSFGKTRVLLSCFRAVHGAPTVLYGVAFESVSE